MAKKKSNTKLYILLIVLIILVVSTGLVLVSPLSGSDPGGTVPADAEPVVETEPVILFDKDDPNLMLVNKDNPLDEDYAPEELVYISEEMRASDRAPQYQRMQPEAAEAFEALVNGAADDGLTIKVTTAYRPYSYQEELYYYYLAVKGEEWTEQYSAPPGASEHQSGLAADVSCPSMNYALDVSFGVTEESEWLENHAHEYGYILRYQEGKEDITGYSYEPWHIRYVGKDAAAEIHSTGVTLEEFLSAF